MRTTTMTCPKCGGYDSECDECLGLLEVPRPLQAATSPQDEQSELGGDNPTHYGVEYRDGDPGAPGEARAIVYDLARKLCPAETDRVTTETEAAAIFLRWVPQIPIGRRPEILVCLPGPGVQGLTLLASRAAPPLLIAEMLREIANQLEKEHI